MTVYNPSGGSSIPVPISLVNGGTGISNARTTVTTSGTVTALPVASAFLVLTAGNVDLQGMVAQADGTEVTIYSYNCNLIVYSESSGASAGNRFYLPGSAFVAIPYNTGSTFRYYGTINRWVLVGGYGYVSSARDGILSTAQYNALNAKPNGNYGANGVAYWYNGSDLTGDSLFGFDPATKRLGVGIAIGSQEATGHFKSDLAYELPALSSFSSVLTNFPLLSPPPSYGATQSAGHLYAPTSPSASESFSGAGYNMNDVIDYRIRAWSSDSGGDTYAVVYATANVTITGATSDTDISWTPNTSGTASITGYALERQVNGGGYNDFINVGNVTSYHDDATGWGGLSMPLYLDFIANGSQRNYKAFTFGSDPFSAPIFSQSSYDINFYDDSSGNPYVISHSVGIFSRVLSDGFNTGSFNDYKDGFTFTEETNTFQPGSTVTPNTFGIQSNGTDLTQSFEAFNYSTPLAIYSSVSRTDSTTDPGDGNYYYWVFNFSGETSFAKIIRSSTDSITSVTSPLIIEDVVNDFVGDTTVTPNSTYVAAGLWQSHGSSITDNAGMISRSLDGSYSRFDFQDASNVRLGSIEQDSSNLSILGKGGAYLQFHNSANTIYGIATTSIQFDSTSFVLNALSSGGGALAYTGANRLTWDGNNVKIGGAVSGYLSGLEVSPILGASYPGITIKGLSSQTGVLLQGVNNSNAILFQFSAGGALSLIGGGLSMSDAKDMAFGTSTGTKIATSTSQKIAFHNSTPVVQRAGAAQAAVATTGATNTLPYGFTTAAQADAIVTLVNELRAALVEKGIVKGSA